MFDNCLKLINQSKEISLKNYLITQINIKRDEITNKEKYINDSLDNGEFQFNKDYKSFIDYSMRLKKKEKEEEDTINELKTKKEKTESLLNEEMAKNKKLEENLDTLSKKTMILIYYGIFIHKVFNFDYIFKQIAEEKRKEKKYIFFAEKIINTYNKIMNKYLEEKRAKQIEINA